MAHVVECFLNKQGPAFKDQYHQKREKNKNKNTHKEKSKDTEKLLTRLTRADPVNFRQNTPHPTAQFS
jgi:hypothetical protein